LTKQVLGAYRFYDTFAHKEYTARHTLNTSRPIAIGAVAMDRDTGIYYAEFIMGMDPASFDSFDAAAKHMDQFLIERGYILLTVEQEEKLKILL